MYDIPRSSMFLFSVKGLIFNDKNELLLLKIRSDDREKADQNKYDLPGGLVGFEEDMKAGLLREIKEETGLSVELEEVVTVSDRYYKKWLVEGKEMKARMILIGFKCKYSGGEVRVSEEHEEYLWVKFDEFNLEILTPNAKKMVEGWRYNT